MIEFRHRDVSGFFFLASSIPNPHFFSYRIRDRARNGGSLRPRTVGRKWFSVYHGYDSRLRKRSNPPLSPVVCSPHLKLTFSFFIEEPAPGNDHESDDARPIKRILRKRKEKRIDDQAITNVDLAQKFGVLSIGEAVCRDFGPDGIFYGTINAYKRETTGELYTVRYSDGDQEDLDTEEYNFA